MKITKHLEISQEFDIHLCSEDISIIFRDDTEDPVYRMRAAMLNLNDIAIFLKGLPDEIINAMTPGQKELISNFLQTQAERYK